VIRRTAWLKRGASPKRKRSTPRRSGRVRDEAWLAEVRKLPCCAPKWPPSLCSGAVEADHVGRRGLGQKCSDRETIPLCNGHHEDRDGRDGNRGPFAGWNPERLRTWLNERIAETQVTVTAALAGIGGSPGVPF
jgi:hypothetical protein